LATGPATANPAADAQATAQTAAGGGQGTLSAAHGGDRTLISSPAGIVAAEASQRSARIAQLTAAVQGGSYEPSSAATSHALVASIGGSGGGGK
jgi:hypothetical protein